MTRRAAMVLFGVIAALASGTAGVLLLRPEAGPVPAPPAVAPAEGIDGMATKTMPTFSANNAADLSVAPKPPPPPPVPSVPSESYEPSGLDPDDLLYPEGTRGPVVVGAVAVAGDNDPNPWVALEAVDDPLREDPSKPEALDHSGYRLTGFKPGRYRVRAQADGAVAVYSMPFDARDGTVVDAGLLRLRARGSIAGLLLGPGGEGVDGEVRLFGRDPASLVSGVVEKAPAYVRQGFQLSPREAGAFRLTATSRAGYAIVDGQSDASGIAWVAVRLQGWGRIAAVMAPPAAAAAGGTSGKAAVLGMTIDPVEVPDLGEGRPTGVYVAEESVDRLVAGKYKVVVRWTPGGEPVVAKTWSTDVVVAAGRESRIEVPGEGGAGK